jgi:hypothetical protein
VPSVKHALGHPGAAATGGRSTIAETSDQGAPGTCASMDTFVTAYRPTFNPATPLTNCVAADDDSGTNACSRMTFTVPPSGTAVIAVTSFLNGATFPYQVNFTGTTVVDLIFKDGFDGLPGCGGTPAPVSGSITLSDPTQTNRLFRDGVPDTCAAPGTCGTPIAGTYHYRRHTFRNYDVATACVNLVVDTACTGANFIYAGAYIGGFDPNAICTN